MDETLAQLCRADAAGVAIPTLVRRDVTDPPALDDYAMAAIRERLAADPRIIHWHSARDGQYYAASALPRADAGFVWARRGSRFASRQAIPLRWFARFASMILSFHQRQDQTDLLLSESRHRSSNDLQLITSLLNFEARRYGSRSAARLALMKASDRVRSLALARRADDAGLAESLQGFVEALSAQVAHRGIAITIASAIPRDLTLGRQRRGLLMIAVNECVTNAIKHGFAERDHGTVRVRLREDDATLIVEIEDDGMPMTPADTAREGSGLDLVARILAGARGRLSLPPEGSKLFRIELPIR